MNESNIIKLPKFNGKKEAFPVWISQFEATCSVKGCVEALNLNFKKSLPADEAETLDAATSDGKAKKKAKVQNTLAMSHLMLAL